MPTNIPNYQKLTNLLVAKGCNLEDINALLIGQPTNKAKEKALGPLCEEYDVSLPIKQKQPLSINSSLKDYFGTIIADLLVKKKLLSQKKEVNADDIKEKSLDEMSQEEKDKALAYLNYEKDKKELSSIIDKLEKRGIVIP